MKKRKTTLVGFMKSEEHEHHHDHEGEALEYGISTFVWQTRKPLDLKKFTNLLNNYPNVIVPKAMYGLITNLILPTYLNKLVN